MQKNFNFNKSLSTDEWCNETINRMTELEKEVENINHPKDLVELKENITWVKQFFEALEREELRTKDSGQ